MDNIQRHPRGKSSPFPTFTVDLWKEEFRSLPPFFLTSVSLKKPQSKNTVRVTSF